MVPNANPNKNPQRTVGDSQRTVGEPSTDPSTPLEGEKRRWGHSSTPLGGPRRPASTALGNASKLLDGVEDDPNGVDRSPQRRWGRRGVNSTPSGKSSDAVERICRRRWGHPQRRRAASKHSPNGVGGIPQRRRAPPNAVQEGYKRRRAGHAPASTALVDLNLFARVEDIGGSVRSTCRPRSARQTGAAPRPQRSRRVG